MYRMKKVSFLLQVLLIVAPTSFSFSLDNKPLPVAVPSGYDSKGDIQTRVYYDGKGKWVSMIRSYGENEMPKDLRRIIKTTYFDYTIHLVNEIQYDGKLIYIIHLSDAKTWINVRYSDGEMEVIEELRKAE